MKKNVLREYLKNRNAQKTENIVQKEEKKEQNAQRKGRKAKGDK